MGRILPCRPRGAGSSLGGTLGLAGPVTPGARVRSEPCAAERGALFAILPLIVLPAWFMAAIGPIPLDFRTGAVAGMVLATCGLVTFLSRKGETARNRHEAPHHQQNAHAAAKAKQQKIRDGGDQRQRCRFVPSTACAPTVCHAVSADMKVVDPETLQGLLRFHGAHSDLTENRRDKRHWGLAALDAIDAGLAEHEIRHERRTGAAPEITGHRT